MVNRFARYIKDTRTEMRHVSWPTRPQTVGYTALVIVISLAVAFFISVFDTAFSRALDWVIIGTDSPTQSVVNTPSADVINVDATGDVEVAPVFSPTGVEVDTTTQ